MKITLKDLNKWHACFEGIEWFENQKNIELIPVLRKLLKEDHFDWANWLIVRYMTYKQCVSYAVYATEQVIDIYEKKYPNDKRPRNAIEVARKCINGPSIKNKNAAYAHAASSAAYVSASADAYASAHAATTHAAHAATTHAAHAATYSASAAYASAHAAHAASSAYSAAYSAYSAAYSAYSASADAKKILQKRIIENGIKLLNGCKGSERRKKGTI